MPGPARVKIDTKPNHTVITKTDNMLGRYDCLWAIFGVDPETGKEGLMATFDAATWTAQPLVTGEEEKVDIMVVAAQTQIKGSGYTARLVKFSRREDLREIR